MTRRKMVYAKEEYTVDGIEITIQQVREDSEPGAWINDGSAYVMSAIEQLPFDVSDKEPFDQAKAAVAFMVDKEVRFCNKCNEFRQIGTFVSTGFAGRKCSVCAKQDATCQDGGKHDWDCTNPNQKHNARVPTKYKCTKCGKKKQSTPTG